MCRARPDRTRRLLPWGAFLLLFVLHGVASHAGVERKSSSPPAEAAPRAGDIGDTHQRLDRIYRRLGIKHEEARREASDSEGCRCRRDERPEPAPERGPELPELSTPAMPPFLGYLLIGAVIVAMLVPLVLSLRASYRREVAGPAPELEDEQPGPAAAPVRGPWQVDLAECRRLLAAGCLAEAFAALHRAFLLALAAERHLVLDSRTTNWEYVRRLSSRPELRQALAAVTLAAEASVLGQHPPTSEHYQALEERVVAATREGGA